MTKKLLLRSLVAAVVLLGFGAPAASADETTPSQCLDGERPPASVVAQVQLNPPVGQAVYLRCGTTISTGVLHIDTRHPVADQDANFVTCFVTIFTRGAYRGPGNTPDLTVWDRSYGLDGVAVAVYENSTGNVVTMYTEGSVSNDWHNCARD
jgi:hypothetical protein